VLIKRPDALAVCWSVVWIRPVTGDTLRTSTSVHVFTSRSSVRQRFTADGSAASPRQAGCAAVDDSGRPYAVARSTSDRLCRL
jgi:hypothetical protein